MYKYLLLFSLLLNPLSASERSDNALAQGDFSQALKLLTQEAKSGSAESQYNLALMYYRGDGVDYNLTKSAELLESSAQQGYTRAIENVGRIYMQLLKFEKAKKWLKINVKNGDEGAAELLKSIEQSQL